MITTRPCATPEQVVQQAAMQLNRIFYSLRNTPVLFLTSGGTALKVLSLVNTAMIGDTVTIGVLDERFSDDPLVNNCAQLMAHPFYPAAQGAGAKFIDTRKLPTDTIATAATRFDDALHEWSVKNSTGQVVITMGMGADGHTSGVMPYPEAPAIFEGLFCQREPWVVGYQATGKNKYPDRITTTISYLRDHVHHAICVISGEEKRAAMAQLMAPEGTIPQTPARVMNSMKNVTLFSELL